MPRRSSTLLKAKILRTSSSTTNTLLPTRSSAERWQGFRPSAGRDDVDVIVTQKVRDAQPLGVIVFNHQQVLAVRLGVFLDSRKGGVETFRRCGFAHKRKGPPGQSVMPVFVQR